jgi:hypothetical protein
MYLSFGWYGYDGLFILVVTIATQIECFMTMEPRQSLLQFSLVFIHNRHFTH